MEEGDNGGDGEMSTMAKIKIKTGYERAFQVRDVVKGTGYGMAYDKEQAVHRKRFVMLITKLFVVPVRGERERERLINLYQHIDIPTS